MYIIKVLSTKYKVFRLTEHQLFLSLYLILKAKYLQDLMVVLPRVFTSSHTEQRS